MCGFTGWIDWQRDLTLQTDTLQKMTQTLVHRGPDSTGIWVAKHVALGHRRLSVMDVDGGAQPMIRMREEHRYVIAYNGELYNANQLKRELQSKGVHFSTSCDTEVLLQAYIEWGVRCVDLFNGIFAFAIWDEREQQLFLARDRLGVKPLFFTHFEGQLLFASEMKALLAHPDIRAEVDQIGLMELFMNGPARTPGQCIFTQVHELLPGQYALFTQNGLNVQHYWKLQSREHTDSIKQTAATVRELLEDAVHLQLQSDVPLCTMLSGGLDSSILTTLAAQHNQQLSGEALHTYSIDFLENDQHFHAHQFQPQSDTPWIKRMSDYLGTSHRTFSFDTPELMQALRHAMCARDLPGMADIDASLLLFCQQIKRHATVALSGEAADEIFGGYPWFFREDALTSRQFPWAQATELRAELLSSDLTSGLDPREYIRSRYEEAIAEVPRLAGESTMDQRRREMSYINITRFMPTLLDRKDRMSMAAGLEVRVPFCDHRLVEYVFNIPWDIKTVGQREKGILRMAMEGLLPEDVLYRKKSPYPKTHHPAYFQKVREAVINIIREGSSPLLPLIKVNKLLELAEQAKPTHHQPWFGQLMSLPQLFAYFIQLDLWLRQYKVDIKS